MSLQDPKTKAKQEKSGQSGTTGKTGSDNVQQPDQQDKKSKAFDQGLFNNSNTQTGTSNSGYDEKNPKQAGGNQQHNPKVTNQENEITNSEAQSVPTMKGE